MCMCTINGVRRKGPLRRARCTAVCRCSRAGIRPSESFLLPSPDQYTMYEACLIPLSGHVRSDATRGGVAAAIQLCPSATAVRIVKHHRPVREAVSYRGLFTAGWFGVREKHCFRLKIYDHLRASEQADKENVQRSEAWFCSSSTGWYTWPDDLVSLDLVRKWSPMMASRLRAVRALFPS